MSGLVAFITARLDEREAAARGAGRIAWLTYRDGDGQMLYTTVASDAGDAWIADGKELPEPASAIIVFDQARVFRDVAAGRGHPGRAPSMGVRRDDRLQRLPCGP